MAAAGVRVKITREKLYRFPARSHRGCVQEHGSGAQEGRVAVQKGSHQLLYRRHRLCRDPGDHRRRSGYRVFFRGQAAHHAVNRRTGGLT